MHPHVAPRKTRRQNDSVNESHMAFEGKMAVTPALINTFHSQKPQSCIQVETFTKNTPTLSTEKSIGQVIIIASFSIKVNFLNFKKTSREHVNLFEKSCQDGKHCLSKSSVWKIRPSHTLLAEYALGKFISRGNACRLTSYYTAHSTNNFIK